MAPSKSENSDPKPAGLLRRGARLVGRVTLTLCVVALAGAAVYLGASELGQRAEAAPTADGAPLIPVSTRAAKLEEGYSVTRAFVGQVEPQKTSAISFELSGRLDAIMVDEGDVVAAGETLAALDTRLLETERAQLQASRRAAEAQRRFALQTVDRVEALRERGHTSQAGLDEALSRADELQARIAEIDAGLQSVEIRLGKSQLVAPFDGRVTVRQVDGGETLAPGQAILELVQLNDPQARIGVPLDLDPARLAEARIEIGGTVYPARLATLRPDVDPVTRTRTALFSIETDGAPAFGQTARLLLAEDVAAEGLWVPVTALKEGVRGQWTVLSVDDENRVRALSVQVRHAESDRVFVTGGFSDGLRLIDDGPHRVTVGQQVTLAQSL